MITVIQVMGTKNRTLSNCHSILEKAIATNKKSKISRAKTMLAHFEGKTYEEWKEQAEFEMGLDKYIKKVYVES